MDSEALAQVLLEMAWELPAGYQVEFIEQAEAIVKRLEDQEKPAT